MDQDHEEDETELENFLENDDVESLQRCIAVGYSVDFILPTVSSNRPELLKSKLPIISFAAFYKSEECVRFLLQNGALINIPDKKGRLPIHFASAGGSLSIITIFNEMGVDYTVRDQQALTSIHYAAMYGNFIALQFLWVNGAAKLDDKAYTRLVQTGITPLHLGAQSGDEQTVNFLLMNGGQINGTSNEGLTPLHYAIIGGHLNMIKLLISHGADPNKTDIYGKTCAQMALEVNIPEIINYFISDSDKDKIALLFDSAETGNIKMLSQLLNEGIDPNNEQTPIHLAVKKKQTEAITLLIEHGADVDWEDILLLIFIKVFIFLIYRVF